MPELSEFVASTAVASLDAFKLGHTQYYILNKVFIYDLMITSDLDSIPALRSFGSTAINYDSCLF